MTSPRILNGLWTDMLHGDSEKAWSRMVYVALGLSTLRQRPLSDAAEAIVAGLQCRLRELPRAIDLERGQWQIQGFNTMVATVIYADVMAASVPSLSEEVFDLVDALCAERFPTTYGETSDLICRHAACHIRIGKLASRSLQRSLERQSKPREDDLSFGFAATAPARRF